MKLSFKRLGDFIHKIDVRNKNSQNTKLLGLSMTKEFRPHASNIVGTDLSRYKVVDQWQFACDFMSTIRVRKLPVVMQDKGEQIIVSPAYTTFEVIDSNILHPEYLMMWFRRSEFDRYAYFCCDSAVRGGFNWDELCDVKLPVPSIDKQRAIVKEYNSIVNRIKLNEQLNQKLEETAQALYKHWFVDFEFPNVNGQPYKSSGGEMVYNEELDKEIPEGWDLITIKEIADEMKNGATPNRSVSEYWNSNDIPWLKTGEIGNNIVIEAEEYISESGFKNSSTKLIPIDSVLVAMYGATAAQVAYLKFETTTNQACCAMLFNSKKISTYVYYYFLINQDEIENMAIGGAQPNLSKTLIEELKILKPNNALLDSHPFVEIIDYREILTKSIAGLTRTKNILLSKMSKVESLKTEQVI